MESVTSIHGLYVSCPKGQEDDYLHFKAEAERLFSDMAKEVARGKFEGTYARDFAISVNARLYLSICISQKDLFVAIDDRKDGNIHIRNHCSFDELKAINIAGIDDIRKSIISMANLDVTKTKIPLHSELNQKWQMLLPHFRSLSKEEKERLRSSSLEDNGLSPVDYSFDKRVDENMNQGRHISAYDKTIDERIEAAKNKTIRHNEHYKNTKSKTINR